MKRSELPIVIALLAFAVQAVGAEDSTTGDKSGTCIQEITKLRFELKENLAKQLKGQQLIQEMAWKTERLRRLNTILQGIDEQIETTKARLNAEIDAKTHKFQPPTEGSELPSPAGLQENIDKFNADLLDAQSRRTSVIGEISECESLLSKLSSGLKQIQDEIQSR